MKTQPQLEDRVEAPPRASVTREATTKPSWLPLDFGEWYTDHRPMVYRYVRFRVATRETAEDVTSQVFMKALRSIHRYDATRAAPRTWLLRIARNGRDGPSPVLEAPWLTSRLPRSCPRSGGADSLSGRAGNEAGADPGAAERNANAARADQEILSLRYGAGLDNSEIASSLDISPNAVAVRVHRALKRPQRSCRARMRVKREGLDIDD